MSGKCEDLLCQSQTSPLGRTALYTYTNITDIIKANTCFCQIWLVFLSYNTIWKSTATRRDVLYSFLVKVHNCILIQSLQSRTLNNPVT